MVADFSKLLSHPDKEEIISKLMTGISSKNIADWLKLKYPDANQGHLRLAAANLKEFTDKIDFSTYNQFKNDAIQATTNSSSLPESIKNNKCYKDRLIELADKEIDIKRMVQETVMLIRARAEQVFDKIQENPQNMKGDYALIKWFELLLNSLEKCDKVVNERPDQVIQHNVQVTEMQTAMFQDAIRETMAEVDPEIAFLFMDKLSAKMKTLQEPVPPKLSSLGGLAFQENRLKEAQILNTTINNNTEKEEGNELSDK